MKPPENNDTARLDTEEYFAPFEKGAKRFLTPFESFVNGETTSSMLLIAATLLALIMANSALATFYYDMTHTHFALSLGPLVIDHSLHHWVNDGLMALFFFVVGLELKREILVGELANPRKAVLPIVAALGGMLVPAGIYYLFNNSGVSSQGWAIPMATDIAFAIGAMVLLGNRVPKSLMAFLVALAIADDLGAVLVIAIFYTEELNFLALFAAAAFSVVLFLFNIGGIRSPIPYFIVAVFLWLAMLFSGVHPTLAGVIGAFAVPARPKYEPRFFLNQLNDAMSRFQTHHVDDPQIITNDRMRLAAQQMETILHRVMTPLQRLEHIWHRPVVFIVIPIFALFNAGVALNMDSMSEEGATNIFFGVSLGLIFGKFLGIAGSSWLALKMGWAQIPSGTSMVQLMGASLLAGIGFTMSIFVAQLSFGDHETLLNVAKAGILAGSLVSGVAGYVWLYSAGSPKKQGLSSQENTGASGQSGGQVQNSAVSEDTSLGSNA
jgi:NhaA family Na+:H+ antiporter